jgi:hypothetical protein
MNDDAKIKITDFGLSRVFNDVQENEKQKNSLHQKQSIGELMAERLRAFAESGFFIYLFIYF